MIVICTLCNSCKVIIYMNSNKRYNCIILYNIHLFHINNIIKYKNNNI